MRDFTLQQYKRLCHILVDSGYTSMTMGAYLQEPDINLDKRLVLIRHDVDSRPQHSLQLAQIECDLGLQATYFHRTIPAVFDAAVIARTAAMGHEIGYHYETLAATNGDMPAAIQLFSEELARLREIAPVVIASMHGSPLKKWDNRDIWEHTSPQVFGLAGEAYRDIDYESIIYLNDSGRTWHPKRYNLRDHTTVQRNFDIDSTADLIALLKQGNLAHVCLSTHPERWQDGLIAWSMQAARDVVINWTKVVIKRVRG